MSGAREIRTPFLQGITPVGKPRPLEKDASGPVVSPVAVAVFEDLDRPAGRPLAVEPERVVPHLDHPELAVGAPLEGDRVADQRLRRHQLDLKPPTRSARSEGFKDSLDENVTRLGVAAWNQVDVE